MAITVLSREQDVEPSDRALLVYPRGIGFVPELFVWRSLERSQALT